MRDKIYPVRLELKVNDDQMQMLKKMAKKYHKTVSQIIRDAIVEKWEIV